jgi:hypothetical protein
VQMNDIFIKFGCLKFWKTGKVGGIKTSVF